MTITPSDVAAYPDWSPSLLLKLTEQAIAELLAGAQSVTIQGRAYQYADLDKLRQLRAHLQLEVSSTDGTAAGGAALVRFADPR